MGRGTGTGTGLGLGLERDWTAELRGQNVVCKVEKNKNPRKGQWTRLYVWWRQPLFQWFFFLGLIFLIPTFLIMILLFYFFKPLWPSRLSHVDTLVEISLVRWCGVAAMLIRLKTLSENPGLPSRSGTSGYKPSGREKVGNQDAPRRTVF